MIVLCTTKSTGKCTSYSTCKIFSLILAILFISFSSAFAEVSPDFISKYEKGVVHIKTFDKQGRLTGSGSGFFINQDGALITNHHVLHTSYEATAETVDGKKYRIKRIVSYKAEHDLVVAEVEKNEAINYYLELATANPQKGEQIVVFGNPQGFRFVATSGEISAIQNFPNEEFKSLPYKGTFLQFSAPISPGSSGGPILNMKGQVVGVTTWGWTKGQNLNFATTVEAIHDLLRNEEKSSLIKEGNEPNSSRKVGIWFIEDSQVLKKLNSEQIEKLENLLSEGVVSKFRPAQTKFFDQKQVAPIFNAYWQRSTGFKTPPAVEDIDKKTLVAFAKQQGYDNLILIGISLADSKQYLIGKLDVLDVSLEFDARVIDTSREDYAYIRLVTVPGRDTNDGPFRWDKASFNKAAIDACTKFLRSFKRDFSVDQLI